MIRFQDKLCNLLKVYINANVCTIVIKLLEVVEYTSAKVSDILHPDLLQSDLGKA